MKEEDEADDDYDDADMMADVKENTWSPSGWRKRNDVAYPFGMLRIEGHEFEQEKGYFTVEDVIVSLDIRGAYNGDNRPEFNDYLQGATEPMEHTVDAGLLLGVSYEHDAL